MESGLIQHFSQLIDLKVFKMGRKIPGKKHRGVKDPEKQKKDREDKVKKQVCLKTNLLK